MCFTCHPHLFTHALRRCSMAPTRRKHAPTFLKALRTSSPRTPMDSSFHVTFSVQLCLFSLPSCTMRPLSCCVSCLTDTLKSSLLHFRLRVIVSTTSPFFLFAVSSPRQRRHSLYHPDAVRIICRLRPCPFILARHHASSALDGIINWRTRSGCFGGSTVMDGTIRPWTGALLVEVGGHRGCMGDANGEVRGETGRGGLRVWIWVLFEV